MLYKYIVGDVDPDVPPQKMTAQREDNIHPYESYMYRQIGQNPREILRENASGRAGIVGDSVNEI